MISYKQVSNDVQREIDNGTIKIIWKYLEKYIEKFKPCTGYITIKVSHGEKLVFIDFNNSEYKIAFDSIRKPNIELAVTEKNNIFYMTQKEVVKEIIMM